MIRTGTALALICALCLTATAGADEAAARRELDAVLARYDALFAAKFRVDATCPEANAILKRQIAGMTQRMFGFALQIDVDHFVFLYNRGRSQVRVALANLPAQQKKQM